MKANFYFIDWARVFNLVYFSGMNEQVLFRKKRGGKKKRKIKAICFYTIKTLQWYVTRKIMYHTEIMGKKKWQYSLAQKKKKITYFIFLIFISFNYFEQCKLYIVLKIISFWFNEFTQNFQSLYFYRELKKNYTYFQIYDITNTVCRAAYKLNMITIK